MQEHCAPPLTFNNNYIVLFLKQIFHGAAKVTVQSMGQEDGVDGPGGRG